MCKQWVVPPNKDMGGSEGATARYSALNMAKSERLTALDLLISQSLVLTKHISNDLLRISDALFAKRFIGLGTKDDILKGKDDPYSSASKLMSVLVGNLIACYQEDSRHPNDYLIGLCREFEAAASIPDFRNKATKMIQQLTGEN